MLVCSLLVFLLPTTVCQPPAQESVLPGVAKVNNSADVFLTPDGGFDGWTSGFQYIADAINPQQAWNIYKAGYGSSPLGNFFNKYRIKVAFLEDNQEQSSFEI